MQILLTTDNHIDGRERLAQWVESEVDGTLDRFGQRITRVEVHLNDVNGDKSGSDDKRCVMEARVAGHQPIAVTHHAATLEDAVTGATEKLERALDHTLGRLNEKKGQTSYGGDQQI